MTKPHERIIDNILLRMFVEKNPPAWKVEHYRKQLSKLSFDVLLRLQAVVLASLETAA